MRERTLVPCALAASLLFAVTAFSHHSFAGTYILDQTKTVEGTVVDFIMRNPHCYVEIDVQDPAGSTQRWGIEWASVSVLRSAGIDQNSLKVGEKVSIKGNAPKDVRELKLLMQRIERPGNGLIWEGTVGNKAQGIR